MKYFTEILKIDNLNIAITTTEPIVNRNPEYFRHLLNILNNTPKR